MLKTCSYWFHGSPIDSSNRYLKILGDRDPEVTKGSEGSLKFIYQSGIQQKVLKYGKNYVNW